MNDKRWGQLGVLCYTALLTFTCMWTASLIVYERSASRDRSIEVRQLLAVFAPKIDTQLITEESETISLSSVQPDTSSSQEWLESYFASLGTAKTLATTLKEIEAR